MSGTDPGAPRPSAILFDLDGTLIATRRLYVTALAEALEPVVGTRLSEAEIMEHRPKAERRFLARLAGSAAIERTLETFYRAYAREHGRHFQGVYEGVPDLLAGLRASAIPLGLVTGKSRRAWEITAPLVELGAFQVVVLDDDVPVPKPDPAGLRLAAERLSVPPEEAMYVGDSLTDLEAARQAGMRRAGVLWSKKPEEREAFSQRARELGGRLLRTPSELLAAGG